MQKLFEACEFCQEVKEGGRDKRLPFGQWEGRGLVILETAEDFSGETKNQMLLDSFPEALFVHRAACLGVDLENARIGCGILLRNLIAKAKIIVLPERMTLEFFGEKLKGSLVEYKTGQYIIPYGSQVTSIDIEKEYKRGLNQC